MLRFITLIFAVRIAAAAVNYSYDDAGRLTTVDYGDGRTIAYTYDPAGNLLSRTMTSASSGGSSKPAAKEKAATRAPAKRGDAKSSPRSSQ